MTLRRHILIFHQAALGDFIMTWPLAMALGRVFAQSRVMYVTGEDKGRLAEDVIGVESLSADGGWHALHGENVEPDERVTRVLRGTLSVVLFAENDEPAFTANIRKYAGDVPIIHVRPNPPPGVHVQAYQLAQLDGHGKLKDYVDQMQTLVRTSGLAVRSTGAREGIVIHPGSGSAKKNWPIESFLDVADRMRQAGQKVMFLLGEVERERFPAAVIAKLRAASEVAEPADLPELRARLSGAAAYFGNDSGPTHLAAAMGLRTVVVFGPASSAEQWQPIGPHVSVLSFEATVSTIFERLLAGVRNEKEKSG